jgi:hypothetical protein
MKRRRGEDEKLPPAEGDGQGWFTGVGIAIIQVREKSRPKPQKQLLICGGDIQGTVVPKQAEILRQRIRERGGQASLVPAPRPAALQVSPGDSSEPRHRSLRLHPEP